MVIAVCVSNDYGMMFNHRRQSADRMVQKRLLEHTDHSILWMSHYSAGQFNTVQPNMRIDDNGLQLAGKNDICFLEEPVFPDGIPQCDQLILYFWNRDYPADTWFPREQLNRWKLKSTCEFKGTSHDVITEKIYEKK